MKIIFGFAAQILSPFVFLLCLPAVIKALCMTQWNVGKSEVPSDRVAKDRLVFVYHQSEAAARILGEVGLLAWLVP